LFGSRLLDAYAKAGRSAEAAKLARELIVNARKASPKDSRQLASDLAPIGIGLLQIKAHAEAEPLLRECQAIQEKVQPEAWETALTRSILGGALMGQEKYDEAGPLLIAGYEGMKLREATIPPIRKSSLTDALERLVEFYQATGKPDEAAKWRKELEASRPQSPTK